MTNRETYTQIFKTVFDVDESVLDEQFNFKDITAWDSITHLTLIGELENSFNILFETDDILNFGGFCNGMRILNKYGVSFEEE